MSKRIQCRYEGAFFFRGVLAREKERKRVELEISGSDLSDGSEEVNRSISAILLTGHRASISHAKKKGASLVNCGVFNQRRCDHSMVVS